MVLYDRLMFWFHKKGSRTSEHVLVLKSLINKYINRTLKVLSLRVFFIDFSAAFDTVSRNAHKLTQIGIGGNFLNIFIHDMYSCRSVSFAVKCYNELMILLKPQLG